MKPAGPAFQAYSPVTRPGTVFTPPPPGVWPLTKPSCERTGWTKSAERARAPFWGGRPGFEADPGQGQGQGQAYPPGVSPKVTLLLAPVQESEGGADPQRGLLPNSDTPLAPPLSQVSAASDSRVAG